MPQKTIPHLSNFGQYIIHEHLDDAMNLATGAMTLDDIMKTLPLTDDGELALGGDDKLEDQLGLPDEIRAVKVGDQVIEQYDPTLVTFPEVHDSTHTVL